MHLFLVVLGGRCCGCHVEQHDVRWVIGETIDDTLPTLKKEWIGLRKGLHLDSYRRIDRVDGHVVNVVEPGSREISSEEPRLWFVNLGAYDASSMAEQHHFGLVVAHSAASAKARARRRWLQGLEQIHKDDLHGVAMAPELDDLLPIEGNGCWSLTLKPISEGEDPPDQPDWFGYRLI